MKVLNALTLLGLLLALFLAPSPTAFGQASEPDLKIESKDIVSTSNPVVLNRYTKLKANMQNEGNCYIVLCENLDEEGYSFNLSMADLVKVKARVRSPGNGNITKSIAVQVRIGNVLATPFSTYSETWEVKESESFTVPYQHDEKVYLTRVSGDQSYDLEID
ncbi:MAG: hypothetical protein ACYTG7_17225 [Planctomycetota bacterium]|jgi:hypothetical protein